MCVHCTCGGGPCKACGSAEKARIAALEAALLDLRLTARVLLQNAQGCVAQHHGSTDEPGWLRDSRLKIEAAETALKG
jgi:hypothetical protein